MVCNVACPYMNIACADSIQLPPFFLPTQSLVITEYSTLELTGNIQCWSFCICFISLNIVLFTTILKADF